MTTIHPEQAAAVPGRSEPQIIKAWALRLVRGREADQRWVRPALLALLAATGFLYIYSLGESGWANTFYAAAVQAGSESWKAWFFGSSDAANFITVDKPPASLWVMGLSARMFGMNSWSMLVPQALEGVAAVGLLYLTVRRRFSPAAGLVAGAVMALTPVAALMFRFNNPDALLVLLMVAAAYAVLRAQETASTKWLVWAGVFLGFGFLAKQLQAFLVLPAFALTYLLFAPTGWWRRIWQLLAAGAAVVVSAGWWILTVELWPASSRPYIGGSQNNSILELTLGYNGLGRLNGDETGSVGGGGARTAGYMPSGMEMPTMRGGGWGETGWDRLFDPSNGGQISWLMPAALALLLAGLWVTRRRKMSDGQRAAFVLWGGWLIGTALVFSFMKGIFHEYYSVALAPAVGALVGMGGVLLWEKRKSWKAALVLAATVAGSAYWAYVLLDRTPDWNPWLRWVVVVSGVLAAAAILATTRFSARLVAGTAAGLTLTAILAGPAAYAVETMNTPHTGAIPGAGPASGRGPGGLKLFGPGPYGSPQGMQMLPPGQVPDGQGQNGGAPGGPGGNRGGGPAPGQNGGSPVPGGAPGGPGGAVTFGPDGTRGMPNNEAGGLLDGSKPGKELTALLKKDASDYTWVAAGVGSNVAAGYQLATGKPVMAIGGFNGSDPAPSLEQFKKYVADGKIHYFVGEGRGGGPVRMGPDGNGTYSFAVTGTGGPGSNGGSDVSSQISAWVQANFTAQTVDGVTVYDLTQPNSGGAAAS
ncbi:ArnT family glycosyltransferase [Yinghuangia soli]|uniref:Glycosyltransferase family 39 protein n=1 Tax=Yinghuangia soli TaxID=2908204 RepID=A0AA41PUT5_9ACTN|nr:glycosyltransferase family 39 protein [Yinghuangia soli]MCF2526143.1 glycosyltransferase family 39 protein [Yinghuangia soli]